MKNVYFKAFVLLVGFVVLAGAFNLSAGNNVDEFIESREKVPYTVEKGDSLWSIASEEMDTEGLNMNMVCNALRKVNELELGSGLGSLKIGEQIIILRRDK